MAAMAAGEVRAAACHPPPPRPGAEGRLRPALRAPGAGAGRPVPVGVTEFISARGRTVGKGGRFNIQSDIFMA